MSSIDSNIPSYNAYAPIMSKKADVLKLLFIDIQEDDKEALFIRNTVSNYGSREGFKDKLKGVVYRLIQCVKAIFGKSDWNKAIKILLPKIMNEQFSTYDRLNRSINFKCESWQENIENTMKNAVHKSNNLPQNPSKEKFLKGVVKDNSLKIKNLKSTQKKLENFVKKHADVRLRSFVACTYISMDISDQGPGLNDKIAEIEDRMDKKFINSNKYESFLTNLKVQIEAN